MSADDGQPPGTATRPNVLFVICDQLRADHLGFVFTSIKKAHNHRGGAVHHVVIGHYVPVIGHDKARSHVALLPLGRTTTEFKEAAQVLWNLLHLLGTRKCLSFRLNENLHHRRRRLLNNAFEIR